ncbi:MAG: crossover junction endodeoxyribonuclease RuvC [Porticoccaceae bacterium]|jgi:crossover junction endodeoxyribonuclease RuvC|nr:crossover junction endodeoxyribonuclease RuvC [Porticoccaceae bacterium]
MIRILGIDPGSRRTGFGIVDSVGSKTQYVASGVIRLPTGELPARLKVIFENISELIGEYQPVEVAIEDVFFARDPRAALKLGQARGAAIVAGVTAGLPVAEYSAKTVKQAVVGNGGAKKDQVQQMIMRLLKLPAPPQEDAADALAVAICHAHSMTHQLAIKGVSGYARGRLK